MVNVEKMVKRNKGEGGGVQKFNEDFNPEIQVNEWNEWGFYKDKIMINLVWFSQCLCPGVTKVTRPWTRGRGNVWGSGGRSLILFSTGLT